MTLQQLKYILAVAEQGSITEAAKSLFISQPSLSNAIRDLEKEIKLTIFVRTSKGVALSNEGTEFLGYARQVMQQAELLESKYITNTPPKQLLCVSTQHYTFVANAFIELIKKYGCDDYEFALNETKTYEIIDDVKTMFSDIGVLYMSSYNEIVLKKELSEKNLSFTELFTVRPHVFLSAQHPMVNKEILRLEELAEYPCVSFCQGRHISDYYSEEIFTGITPRKSIKVSDRAAIINMMLGLNGYTISSGIFPKDLHGADIVSIPLDFEEKIQVGYILNRDRNLSDLGNIFIDALKEIADGINKI